VAIGLGSNVGDSLAHLREAVAALRASLTVTAISSVYRTAPMYVEDQPPFLNAALIAETELGPRTLLRLLKETECETGRRVRERYGPREIDLDLIAYGSLAYSFEGDKALIVPHPKTIERRFVLMPLSEIAPRLKLVGLGAIDDLLEQTNSQSGDVERLDDAQL
jgi:2-amino-4-hydroxy-6-hydroxymethyldihydropteridine diphosphokinase